MKEHESVQAVKIKPKPPHQWLKSGAGQSSVKQNTKGSGQKIVIFVQKRINGVSNIALPMAKCATDVDEKKLCSEMSVFQHKTISQTKSA